MAPQLNDSDKIKVLAGSPRLYAERVTQVYVTTFKCSKSDADAKTVAATFEKLRRKQQLSQIERDTLVGYYNLLKKRSLLEEKDDPELGLE
jgi:hypothetical protein